MTKKGLDLIQRQQPEFINDFPTGNICIGLTSEELEELKKELKVFEIIESLDFDLDFDESQNEWFLYICNGMHCMLVAKGTGIKTHNLLKEVLFYE